MSTSTDKRGLLMRKLLTALLLTSPVYAQGHLHLWQLVSKSADPQPTTRPTSRPGAALASPTSGNSGAPSSGGADPSGFSRSC